MACVAINVFNQHEIRVEVNQTTNDIDGPTERPVQFGQNIHRERKLLPPVTLQILKNSLKQLTEMFRYKPILAFMLLNGIFVPGSAQNLLDRLRPANLTGIDDIKVVSGTKVKRYERMTVPLGGIGPVIGGIGAAALLSPLLHPQPAYLGYAYVPQWQAGAKLMGEGESASAAGMISFQQLPYNSDIRVTINVTGLPPGKHALHIHTYGDVSEGCKSTGGQFPNNFLGNLDVKADGSISAVFMSIYLQLFGFNGIVGRSVVIHSKPIDLNTALNAEVFSSALTVPNALAYQNEEMSVGAPIACGVISLMSTSNTASSGSPPPTSPPTPQGEA